MSVFLFNENFVVAIFSSFFSLNCIFVWNIIFTVSIDEFTKSRHNFFNYHKQFVVISGEKVVLNKSNCVTLHQKIKGW